MEFFSNKKNESLKFKINSEGIDVDVVEPRLVLVTKENKNYIFLGKISEGICEFKVPELEQYVRGNHGIIRFEIISEDLYFPVWEEKFEIKTKSSIKIEEMYSQIKESSKPNISSVMLDSVEEEVVEEPVEKNIMKPMMESLESEEEVVEKVVEKNTMKPMMGTLESEEEVVVESIIEAVKEEVIEEEVVEPILESVKE